MSVASRMNSCSWFDVLVMWWQVAKDYVVFCGKPWYLIYISRTQFIAHEFNDWSVTNECWRLTWCLNDVAISRSRLWYMVYVSRIQFTSHELNESRAICISRTPWVSHVVLTNSMSAVDWETRAQWLEFSLLTNSMIWLIYFSRTQWFELFTSMSQKSLASREFNEWVIYIARTQWMYRHSILARRLRAILDSYLTNSMSHESFASCERVIYISRT